MKRRSYKKKSHTIINLAILCFFISTPLEGLEERFILREENTNIIALPGLKSCKDLENVLNTIYTSVRPAVVNIEIEGLNSSIDQKDPDPFFKFFFGDSEHLKRQYNNLGSGFIVTSDGYIFSNWHIVKNASFIKVTLSNEESYEAKLIGADTELDIALLKINAKDLPVIPLGYSDTIKIGDFSILIGNPFGLINNFKLGNICSLTKKNIIPGLSTFIHSDIRITPQNSGSPLLNIEGQVIGINTCIHSKDGIYEGIDLVIPINMALNIVEEILSSDSIEKGFLGIIPQELDASTRKLFDLEPKEGILISSLEEGAAAYKHGLKQGDIIIKINNEMISQASELTEMIAKKSPNSTIEVEILRDKKKETYIVTLGKRPSSIIRKNNKLDSSEKKGISTEISFRDVIFTKPSDKEFQKNGIEHGVLVKKIDPSSPFAFILSTGDIISSINGSETYSIENLKEAIFLHQDSLTFVFSIYKNGFLVYRSIQL